MQHNQKRIETNVKMAAATTKTNVKENDSKERKTEHASYDAEWERAATQDAPYLKGLQKQELIFV